MPKVAYSEEERADIRKNLIAAGLDLMAKQGIQHTTIQQIYERVGISRTFFYTFFSTKEEFVVEMLYVQQPKIIAYTETLMSDPNLSWRDAVKKFLHSCCYGEKNGIAVLTIEEQQLIFRRLSKDQEQIFREKQRCLFGNILESFGIKEEPERIAVLTNLCLTVHVIRRAIPDTLPLFVPEAADKTIEIQIDAIVDTLEGFRTQ